VARVRPIALLAAALVSAGCGASRIEERPTPERGGPPGLFTVGSRLYGVSGRSPVRLAGAPVSPLAGWMSPAAAQSSDGRYVAYNVWQKLRDDDPARSWSDQGIEPGDSLAIPQIRLVDLELGRDELLAEGAYSVAWRPDGALAYARGVEHAYRAFMPYETELIVRARDGAEQRWSADRAQYVAVAWAADTLIAYRISAGEHVDTLVFDRPGRERLLVEGGTLVALSPDGSKAFVEEGAASGRPRVRVVDVATGETQAALPLHEGMSYAGDWRRDLVVARGRTGLVVFRVREGEIEIVQKLAIDEGAKEPRFTDAAGTEVVATRNTPRGEVFLRCDRKTRRCAELRPGSGRLVYNPSRPR
jgi:hypothetical protein